MLNAPKDYVVDVEAVCRRVVNDPRNARVSTVEQLAVCAFALEASAPAEPPLKASLAATLALAVAAWDTANGPSADSDELAAWLAFDEAFNTLKTRFEEEFPHGSD